MLRFFLNIPFIIIFGCTTIVSSFAQSREELEKKREKLMKDIEYTQKLLKETEKSRASSFGQLTALRRQISAREELIDNYHREIYLLDGQIRRKAQMVMSLENDLEELKNEYAKMIVAAYRTRSSYSKLLFLFSSRNFNDLYRRYKYYERFAEYRNRQAGMIRETQSALTVQVRELEQRRTEKRRLLGGVEQQKISLDREKEEKNKMLSSLQKKEKQLRKDLDAKKKAAESLRRSIEKAIKSEMTAAKKKSPSGMPLTPDEQKLSADFKGNMGSLPWPVERGIITDRFGKHSHPALVNVQVNNNGVDIMTEKESEVRAIFGGTVGAVFFNPSYHNAVLIQHGEYYTVYANLDEVFVKKGQKVSARQRIGKVHTDAREGKAEVHLEVWRSYTDEREPVPMNPEMWLNK